ncbi:CvpA family protein [Nitrosovibrio tenuis]|uniref:Membrane protein required for colicin V production n=1 Tax=Nitrosovibrio tenuis TaxID=1233 RepID=A0A1H7MPN7_9PROT|nr:CvpA family protein [Nitrosovibrio tenuis]SEL13039.1 membrane protein required for colicin V production [Nitrosovibrio tenuis]
MTAFDYCVLAILGISILLSLVRGVVRELVSLAGWIVAFMVANSFASQFAPILPSFIAGESLRMLFAFAALFLATLVAVGLIAMAASSLTKTAGLGLADRFLGSLFGFIRGLLVVLLIVLTAGLTALPQEPFWRKAVLSGPLETAVMFVVPWLPQDLSRHINFVRLKRNNERLS